MSKAAHVARGPEATYVVVDDRQVYVKHSLVRHLLATYLVKVEGHDLESAEIIAALVHPDTETNDG